jgi:hypothetical protein
MTGWAGKITQGVTRALEEEGLSLLPRRPDGAKLRYRTRRVLSDPLGNFARPAGLIVPFGVGLG